MIIRYSTFAVVDLEIIYTHISQDNLDAAQKVKLKIQGTIDSLTLFPRRGHHLNTDLDVLKLAIPKLPYVVYYELHEQEIWIVRVFHQAQERS